MTDKGQSITIGFNVQMTSADRSGVAQLVVIAGPLRGASFDLDEAETTIGRRQGNTICLPTEAVSKTHCRIVRADSCWTIADASSTNGTFVNGRRLEVDRELQLDSGDTITICDTRFLFLAPQSAQAATIDQITIDGKAASAEADEVLSKCEEALVIARKRRERRGR